MLAASKCDAFSGRGGGDYLASHDLEDLFALLAGDAGLRATWPVDSPATPLGGGLRARGRDGPRAHWPGWRSGIRSRL